MINLINNNMKYPTKNEVNTAEKLQTCKWHWFLPSPQNTDELTIHKLISKKYKEFGGMTTEISKQIGW